jgi:hypothetical protein
MFASSWSSIRLNVEGAHHQAGSTRRICGHILIGQATPFFNDILIPQGVTFKD